MMKVISTKLGELEVVVNGIFLIEVNFVDQQNSHSKDKIHTQLLGNKKELNKVINELQGYMDGKRKKFSVKMDWEGTEFQKKVWQVISQIPYGQTMTYKEIARQLGNEKSYRAVANACGANRIPIVNPCHRVVGSNGGLGGYSGGLWRKKWMLDMENSKYK